MKRWHKFVLVLSVLSVLITSFVFTSFADSAGFGDTTLKPLFAPSAINVNNGNEAVVFSGFSDVVVYPTSSDDTSSGSTSLEDFDANARGYRDFYLGPPIEKSQGIYSFNFTEHFYYFDNWDYFVLNYNDFYYSGSSISSFSHYFINSIEFDSIGNYTVSVYALDCDISYLSFSGNLVEESLSLYGSSIRSLFDDLDLRLSSNYSSGALVQNISVYPAETSGRFNQIYLAGTIDYVGEEVFLGSDAALLAWSDYFVGDVIIESPTILESITRGLNSVWNTSLFGSFTIGQAFSACAGLALFGWLLKIFSK